MSTELPTPKSLWCPITPSSRKHWLSEDPWFWPKYSNGPGVAKNWHMLKLTSRDPRRCLETKFDKKIPMGSVPNCQKEIAMHDPIRWFKCKLKPPKKSNIWLWRRFRKIINWHNEVHRYWYQFWHLIKIGLKYFLWTCWGFLMTIICDVKIDANTCEPDYVNLFLLWTSSIV